MNDKNRISTIVVILPAFNEGKLIGTVLDALPRTIKIKQNVYQITPVVVNDGSSDNTASIVLKRKKVHLINHIFNCGPGAATRTGLIYANKINCSIAVTMDSDGQHDIGDVLKVIRAVVNGEGDLIIGSRLIDSIGMPWFRNIGNKGLSLITFLLFGVFVTDSQSGMRGFSEKALKDISFRSNNFAFCSEMIWRAKQKRLRIKEIPIKAIYTDYSLAKGQNNWGALHIVQQLLKQRILEFLDE